jgi:hypothetical protein
MKSCNWRSVGFTNYGVAVADLRKVAQPPTRKAATYRYAQERGALYSEDPAEREHEWQHQFGELVTKGAAVPTPARLAELRYAVRYDPDPAKRVAAWTELDAIGVQP